METRIHEALNGRQANYILPFFWQHGETEETLRNYMKVIHDMGIGAVCLESRPHPDFAGPRWWQDFDIILDEARKRSMKIWILDDCHFPTGYANGAMEHADRDLQKWTIYHLTVDLAGPSRVRVDVSSLLGKLGVGFPLPADGPLAEEKELLCAVLYRRKDETSDDLTPEYLPLTDSIANGLLPIQVPEGFHRLFLIYQSRNSGLANNQYVNLLQKESVRILIDQVYEPHYRRYREEFGRTIAGFFSDEPGFYNCIDQVFNFHAIVGKTDMPLPWSHDLADLLFENGAVPEDLIRLWYNISPEQDSAFRYRYMDLVSRLYQENFSMQLGDWCRAHHVEYIGHILEDNNSSSRLGPSAGHYFRAMAGQDFSGIDVVTSQILPGRTNTHTTNAAYNTRSDGEFYHYALAKLGASDAHLDPKKQGRAMCEIFGNYGWAEGLETMKWLADFMLARGINIFVPHAFSPREFPDPDCPPHFYAHGNNLQWPYMKYLFTYMNRMSHILTGGRSCSKVGILYHGEAEWAGEAMLFQKPGRVCLENQVDYDVIPADLLKDPDSVLSGLHDPGELSLGALDLRCLIIPACRRLPLSALQTLAGLAREGFPVIFTGPLPEGCCEGQDASRPLALLQKYAFCTRLSSLKQLLRFFRLSAVEFCSKEEYKDLRVYQYKGAGYQCLLLMNESISRPVHQEARFPFAKPVLEYDVYRNRLHHLAYREDWIQINLEPGESRILLADMDISGLPDICPARVPSPKRICLPPDCLLSVSTAADHGNFRPKGRLEEWRDLSLETDFLDFHGILRYETDFTWQAGAPSERPKTLLIEGIHEAVEITVNGRRLPALIAPPYRFEISEYIKEGKNHLVIDNITTVFPSVKDHPSINTGLRPMGIYGGLWLEY